MNFLQGGSSMEQITMDEFRKNNEIFRQIETCEESRAKIFEAYSSASKLNSPADVAQETGLSERCVKSRTEELLEQGRIWPCCPITDETTGEIVNLYTTNPHVALAYAVILCKEVINQFRQFPQAQICLIVAIREYVIERRPHPFLIYDVDGTLARVWKDCIKPVIDEEFQ